ncbi:synaptotagmin-14-like [Pollicipes pollicipes]|uniref:synaptotagmin-14-like n=1 Tax=Pollicipes pollicipes TaxID=41117 RepID=UPI00188500B2|nr:synaptotagmin-14-like [Pollicipes pollicipes]
MVLAEANASEVRLAEEPDDTVPAEATVFLGAVGVLLVLLLLAFLYMNKRICLYDLGGHCCEELLAKPSHYNVRTSVHEPADGGDSSSEPDETVHGGIGYERPSLYRQFSLQPAPAGTAPDRPPSTDRGPDLSLAERGRVGGGTSSSSSSTTSGEDDLTSSLRHRDVRRHGQLSGRTRSLDAPPEASTAPCLGPRITHTEERLFDVADLEEPDLRSPCGAVEVAFAYDFPTKKLTAQLLQARNVPSRDRGGASSAQVRLVLLPGKKSRLRSRVQPGPNPQFNEALVFHKVSAEDLPSMGVRLRLYGCERLRRERMIGEAAVPFSSVNMEQQTPQWVSLQPRANMTLAPSGSSGDISSLSRSDSTGSTQSIQRGGLPELLLGLQYSAATGRLAAEVVKGSQFRSSVGSRAPDTYVRLHLLTCNGQEIARSKTSLRRGQPNPLYKETFIFQVPLFQLCDVTLMVSVYNKRSMKKRDLIGWFALGHNSSGAEERSHWTDLRHARDVQICRWHVLCEE